MCLFASILVCFCRTWYWFCLILTHCCLILTQLKPNFGYVAWLWFNYLSRTILIHFGSLSAHLRLTPRLTTTHFRLFQESGPIFSSTKDTMSSRNLLIYFLPSFSPLPLFPSLYRRSFCLFWARVSPYVSLHAVLPTPYFSVFPQRTLLSICTKWFRKLLHVIPLTAFFLVSAQC